jgi:hypothetical protein
MKEEDINKAGDNEQLELTNEISLTEEIPPTDDNSQEKDSSEEHNPSLTEILKERATEDEAPLSRTFSLKKILGGDILYTSFIRRQVWLFLLIAMFMVVYIANRYSCQQDIIEIDKLQDELLDAKYKALSSNSQLTEKSRQSNILDMLKNNKDSTLKLPTQPPYIITVPE